jgi:hypothetical protein
LLAGLVLPIECDERPQQAREKLEAILGPPTAVLYSGGKWQAPDGTVDDKLHLHWRLAALALGNNLAKLKRARGNAARRRRCLEYPSRSSAALAWIVAPQG